MTGPAAEPVPPGRWWGDHVGETRWILDAARLNVDPVWRGRGGIPHGDGRAVVLVPGFGGGDYTLAALAAWLHRIGYRPAVCGFLLNTDCSERALERVERQVAAGHDRSGRRVAVIGHSRGGHFARAVAARRPELVSHAISLGADLQAMFHCSAPTLAAVDATRKALHQLGRARRPECMTYRCDCTFTAGFFAPFPEDRVRMTSIYSKGDGVVRWQAQVVPYADCVEVTGSHVGLIFNRKSYRAIAHALAADELGSSIIGARGARRGTHGRALRARRRWRAVTASGESDVRAIDAGPVVGGQPALAPAHGREHGCDAVHSSEWSAARETAANARSSVGVGVPATARRPPRREP